MSRIKKYKLSELKEAELGGTELSQVEVFEITTESTFFLSVLVEIDNSEYDIKVGTDEIFDYIASQYEVRKIKLNEQKCNCIVSVDDITGSTSMTPVHIYFEENKYDILKELITKNLI